MAGRQIQFHFIKIHNIDNRSSDILRSLVLYLSLGMFYTFFCFNIVNLVSFFTMSILKINLNLINNVIYKTCTEENRLN